MTSLVLMALFSQTSTTGSVIGFSLLILISIVYCAFDIKDKKFHWSARQISYVIFFVICLISIVVNLGDYVIDWGNIQKARYFIFAVIISFSFRYLYRTGFFTENRLRVLTYLTLSAITIVTIASYIGREVGYNLFKMQPVHESQRLEGVVSVGNYGMELPILTLFFLALLVNFRKSSLLVNRNFLIVCLLINLSAVYFSGMRSAFYGFVIAMPFIFYFHGKKFFLMTTALSVLIIGAVVAGTYYQKVDSRLFLKVTNESNTMRLSMWKKSIEAFKERPIIGHGYLSHNLKYLAEDASGNEVIPLHIAHSSYLQVLKDTGIIGIFTYLMFLLLWFRNIVTKKNILSKLTLAAFVCALFHGIAHNFLINGSNSAMLLAVLYAMSELDLKPQKIIT